MLKSLHIKNYTIVKDLELDFSHGMTAFTGETGAGKSIMIDALMLALGGRSDSSEIRPGEDKCDISAVFQISPESEAALWLKDNEIACEDDDLVLRRVLTMEGRSKSYINAQLFPLQKMKELSSMLVHIHGQHQHQTLLQHGTHRVQLDHYAQHTDLLTSTAAAYKQCQNLQNELKLLQNQTNPHHRLELLQFQIEELQALQLQDNESMLLNEEHQLLHHAQDYLQNTQKITQLLRDDDALNVTQMLNQILQILQELPAENAALKRAAELLNNALIHCEESFNEMEEFAEQISLDPERLQEVEKRLSELHAAARKHHVEVGQLRAHAQQLEAEYAALHNADSRINQLQEDYAKAIAVYDQAALKLRDARNTAAPKLCQAITDIIQQLGMPHGKVTMDIQPLEKRQAHGMDKIEYIVSTNPGMMPEPLNKIASGGELSRISLAIQMVTAQKGATPTLLFDEVDVGIGGATAAKVGKLLRELGQRLQVFCVTHQPQVASSAHHHFLVEKHSDNQQTYSRIISLDNKDKVDEIARMLGGLTITEQTRSHAKELLDFSLQV